MCTQELGENSLYSLNDTIKHSKSWLNPKEGAPSTDGFSFGGALWDPVSGNTQSGDGQKPTAQPAKVTHGSE